ncbi:MAG: hypothetical protein V3V75_01420 [Thermoguttaceae bacterium]
MKPVSILLGLLLCCTTISAVGDSENDPKGTAATATQSPQVPPQLVDRVDWPAFLARHDMGWNSLPQHWYDGPFLGNGMMGAMLYRFPQRNALRLEVCRSDVQDHRSGMPTPYTRPRLPIGYFSLAPVGVIISGTMHLDLYNAELRGHLITDHGEIKFRSIVHAQRMLIMVELTCTEGESGSQWIWHPAKAISPRQAYKLKHNEPLRSAILKPNPPHELRKTDGVDLCVQPVADGETATAWKSVKLGKGEPFSDGRRGHRRMLYVTVAHSHPKKTAHVEAVDNIRRAVDADPGKLFESNRRWWNDFYTASFLSIPDTPLESFYWIQMYKLAAATRSDLALIDNQGPWLEETPRPYATWNLNVQLSYWPTYDSNRLSLGESLWRALKRNEQNLVNNVPAEYRDDSAGIGRATTQDCIAEVGTPGITDKGKWHEPEVGLLPWALHNVWLHYRHSMDDKLLADVLYPLLRRSTNYYLHFLSKGNDGRLHLPETYSPEYGNAADCNFDLALIRWSCQTLLWASDRLKIDDPLRPKWREVLDKLADYPTDENGLMIGRDVPLSRSHRHHSHLLAIYPLRLINWDQAENRGLIEKSLRHWHSLPAGRSGHSLAVGALIMAEMGRGNEALELINEFVTRFSTANTMYKESRPAVEAPLSCAQAIQEMLLQSWGGTIRLFPAVPYEWKDVVFRDLLAEGAFEVSAVRRDGHTQWAQITSLAGEPCRVKIDLLDPVNLAGPKDVKLEKLGDGLFKLDMKQGQTAVLYSGDKMPELIIVPVSAENDKKNSFGLRRE